MGSASRPDSSLLLGKTRYPLYRRLCGSQARSGRAEYLVPTGIRSPNRPARSQSLYRLSYRAHTKCKYCTQINYIVRFTLTDSRYLILCFPSITILTIFIVLFGEVGTPIKFFSLLRLWWFYKVLFTTY